MKILVEDGIHLPSIKPIKSLLEKSGITSSVFTCKIDKNATMRELSYWTGDENEKVLIITKMKIKTRAFNTTIGCKGITDSIGGRVAIVSYENTKHLPYICLHETLHLNGLPHCHQAGCIMSLKLCSGEIKYCTLCKNPCKPINICSGCERLWLSKFTNKAPTTHNYGRPE